MFTQSGSEYWSFPVQTRWPSSCQHQECFTGGYPLVSHLLKGTKSRFSPPWLSVRSGCYPVVFFSVILTHSLHDPCPTKGIDFFFFLAECSPIKFPVVVHQPGQGPRSGPCVVHHAGRFCVGYHGQPIHLWPVVLWDALLSLIIYHSSSLHLFQSHARCLVFWKSFLRKNRKNKNSCMFIYLLIDSLSTEALRSGPWWIGLAAIWTWRVVARSWLYQRSHCRAHCLGRETEEKGGSCPEEMVVILTQTVPFIHVLLSYKALVVKTSLRALLQGAVRLAPKCCGILISLGFIVRLNDWDLLVLRNQLSSKPFSFPITAWNRCQIIRYLIPNPTSLVSAQRGSEMWKRRVWILSHSTWQSEDTHFGSKKKKELSYYSGNHSIKNSLEQRR